MLQNRIRVNYHCFYDAFVVLRDEGWHGLDTVPVTPEYSERQRDLDTEYYLNQAIYYVEDPYDK